MSEANNYNMKNTCKSNGYTKRIMPAIILIVGLSLFFILDIDQYFTLNILKENRQWFDDKVNNNLALTIITFITIYIITVAFSLPGATILTISGGFLFGAILGVIFSLIGATVGATILFLLAKSLIGGNLKSKAGPWLSQLEDGFNQNAFSYMLFLRLNPAFPFCIVNLAPAFIGVKLRCYMVGTFFGIMPGTAVFSYLGAGLDKMFEKGTEVSLATIISFEIIVAFFGLAMLALLPILIKRFQNK